MPSLLLLQALFNRKIGTAEDETEENYHNDTDVESGGLPSRQRHRGYLSQLSGRRGMSEADAESEGPSSSPNRDHELAYEDALDGGDENDDILDSSSGNGTEGLPRPPLRGTETLTLSTQGERHPPMNRFDTAGSSPASSWERKTSPVLKALKKIKDFIFQTDPAGYKKGTEFPLNYRYLPILSGVLSPFAILLEIPGLTEYWYIRTENHRVVEVRENVPIVMTAMAVSMACGFIANAALIARFFDWPVMLNTWLAISALFFHDAINIIVVTVFGVIHRFDDGFTYGEAFWMCVCSTIFSVIVTGTLLYDFWATPDFAKSGSGLTRKQRSLLILVMILLCYIALGSLVFSELIGLTFQDGLYYTVVSIETIGFGDITPNNTASILFCIFYSTIGIINVGLVINTTRETIIESFENAYSRRSAEIARRQNEDEVRRVQNRERRVAIEKELHDAGLPLYVRAPEFTGNNNIGVQGSTATIHHRKMILNESGLEEWRKKRAEELVSQLLDPENTEVTIHDLEVPEHKLDADAKRGRALVAALELKTELAMSGNNPGQSHGETFAELLRRIRKEEKREFSTKLIIAWTFFFLFWLTGAGVFMATEKEWTFGRSLYFCWMTFSTIGYGEIVPKSPAGRAVFVVWALMGVAAMTILIAVLSEAYGSRYKSVLRKGSYHTAMKTFEGKVEAVREKVRRSEKDSRGHVDLDHEETRYEIEIGQAKSLSELAQKILESSRRHLDPIPLNVITHAKTFHDHVRYFVNHPQYPTEPLPRGLDDLLDEIAKSEKMDERMKQELLGDAETRKALFFMSYERAFRKFIDTAEKAVEIIDVKGFEWEGLVEMLKQREGIPADTSKYENRRQRTTSGQIMALRKRENSRNTDEGAQDEKQGP